MADINIAFPIMEVIFSSIPSTSLIRGYFVHILYNTNRNGIIEIPIVLSANCYAEELRRNTNTEISSAVCTCRSAQQETEDITFDLQFSCRCI